MFSESLFAISQASDLTSLRASTCKLVSEFGFNTFAVAGIRLDQQGRLLFNGYHNMPDGYLAAFNNTENAKLDPVMQHLKHHSAPIVWGQSNYLEAGQGALFEEQAPFGLRHGIAVALHLPGNRHVAVGFESPDPLPSTVAARTEMLARFQLYAAYFTDAAERLLIAPGIEREVAGVTQREREAILWTSQGKTAWEIGQILSLSESMVNKVLGAIQQKLGCVTKAQTVAKAIRLGIIN
jgi:DNA-binding CsgD family transcriptional regulator